MPLFLLLLLLSFPALADPPWEHHGGEGWHGGGGGWGWRRPEDGGWENGAGNIIGGAIGSFLWHQWAEPNPPVVVVPQAVPAAPTPGSPAYNAYCFNKYHSFDPGSGTYVGYDGLRHPCL
jgi:hypothetical protein